MARSEDGQDTLPTHLILVGLGKMEVSEDPEATLRAFGIGSTVAVSAYDPVRMAGGMLHAMLPHNNMVTQAPTKFVDTGIRALKEALLAMGLVEERLIWRFTGGGQVLGTARADILSNIARENIASATDTAARCGMAIFACEVGGHKGRTASLRMADGRLQVCDSEGHCMDFEAPAPAACLAEEKAPDVRYEAGTPAVARAGPQQAGGPLIGDLTDGTPREAAQ
jgi:chemotaxis protein CheD